MKRALLFGVAALALLSSRADARDGCGQGWFFNGVACAPQERGYPGYRGYNPGYRDYYGGPRYYPQQRNYYGNTVRPTMGRNGSISCSNPNYTWQDGACKPYRGP